MDFKVPALICCLAAPFAVADVDVYPHTRTNDMLSVQVYQDNHKAMNANVVVMDAQGRTLAQGKTNSHGWVNLKNVRSNQAVTVQAKADGEMGSQVFYVETNSERRR